MLAFALFTSGLESQPVVPRASPFQRVVILKVDGLSDDLLQEAMRQQNPASGKSTLPWFSHVFDEHGLIFNNFYVRGVSLSAPSWSILDTGHHAIIRGNVEYDRYTGQVYDYLSVVPFYLGYARKSSVDMPGTEVLDRAGVPLLIDQFPYAQTLQSFQLFQRGVSWMTLKNALMRSFSPKAFVSIVESGAPVPLSTSLAKQIESELLTGIGGATLCYLDFFSGDADHEGHATNDPAALRLVLEKLDGLVGRIWTAIQNGPLAQDTLFVVVSDHGMNNVRGIVSQTFSLPDLFNREEGGAHHVVTDREQLSDFKLKGLNPLVHRVTTPSTRSFYLAGQAYEYPTAWLDIDGNERASVHLRQNDLNRVHILLQQLSRKDLDDRIRKAAAAGVSSLVEQHRAAWSREGRELGEELAALKAAIEERRTALNQMPKKVTTGQHERGEDKVTRRLRRELEAWSAEQKAYGAYLSHLQALLSLRLDPAACFTGKIAAYIPPLTLGDNNTLADLRHYVVGPANHGLSLDANGSLDEERSFRHVDYFSLLSRQVVRNNPQEALTPKPVDFVAMRLPDDESAKAHAYLLYRDESHQLTIFQDGQGNLRLEPFKQEWTNALPLELWEDPQLQLPPGTDRARWLSTWHREEEWLAAIHQCRYSNGVIGITEELSPVSAEVPGPPNANPLLQRYEKRRRELVAADFHVFAADHWNFNARFPNPGGNHGSFFRISTHSVWMMAGSGLPVRKIDAPYDSLNFASTVLQLLGRQPPIPERVVKFPK